MWLIFGLEMYIYICSNGYNYGNNLQKVGYNPYNYGYIYMCMYIYI